MVLKFTVANLNIYNKCLLNNITSPMQTSCKVRGSEWQKVAGYIGF